MSNSYSRNQDQGAISRRRFLKTIGVSSVVGGASLVVGESLVPSVKAVATDVEEASYIVYVDAGITYARNGNTGLIDFSGSNPVVVLQSAHDALGVNGGHIIAKGRLTYSSSPLIINNPILLSGLGSGQWWKQGNSSLTSAPTILEYQGSGQAIKIQPNNLIGENENFPVVRDLKVLYSGVPSNVVDGLFMDASTGNLRNLKLENVNVSNFTGIGIHAKGAVFDVKYDAVGVFSPSGGGQCWLIEASGSQIPSQHYWIDCKATQNNAGLYCVRCDGGGEYAWFGGTISNLANGSGLFFNNTYTNKIYGANLEGNGRIAGSIALIFTGSDMFCDVNISGWDTGVSIGAGDANSANNYILGGYLNNNTDVVISARGARPGRIDARYSSLTNYRGTVDQVWNEVKITRRDPTTLGPVSNIAVGQSPYLYANQDLVAEEVQVVGGSVTNVEILRGGTATSLGISNGIILLEPGDCIRVTFSAAPAMRKIPH